MLIFIIIQNIILRIRLLSLYRTRLLITLHKAETEIWFISENDTFKRPINHDRRPYHVGLKELSHEMDLAFDDMYGYVSSKPK
jgi:hypothetical protein